MRIIWPSPIADPAASLLIVCDGVSNSRHPDLASAAAAECIRLSLEQSLRNEETIAPDEQLRAAFRAAQEAVAAIPFAPSGTADYPSTTAVAAVVMKESAWIGWLGDSRAYWIGEAGARQLTADHSWLNDALAAGTLSAEDANRSPYAHAITRWLGAREGIAGADSVADETLEPEIIYLDIRETGMLLLCTDGLWNYIPEPDNLADLARSFSGGALAIARGLVNFARSKGGNDNITAVVWINVDPQSASISDQ